jgi:carbon monoxide dehydrogenase subunit G
MPARLEPFAGEENFAAPPARLFATLTNPDALADAMPNRISHERIDDRTLRCTVRPGFSFVRANMQLTVVIAEAVPDSAVALNIASKGIGASMKVECKMRISPDDSGQRSKVEWEATVAELSGLISAVSPALIRGAADKVIRDGWDAIRQQVEQAPAAL